MRFFDFKPDNTESPKIGSIRTKEWFAIFPVTIGRQTRWFEKVKVRQKLSNKISYTIESGYGPIVEDRLEWINMEFVN